jgi:hypothetical protein
MPAKEVFVDSDKNVTAFPKSKKQTPDDLDSLPLAHVCSVEDNIQSFRWCIQMRGDGLWFVCSNCGIDMSLEQVMECYNDL